MPLEAKHLETVFPEAVCDVLATVAVGAKDIVDERSKMSGISFGPTNNRSLLGTLNDFAFMAQRGNANLTEPESPEEMMRFLAQTPIPPLDGASPIALRPLQSVERDSQLACEHCQSWVSCPQLQPRDQRRRQEMRIDPANPSAVQSTAAHEFDDIRVRHSRRLVHLLVRC
jgi:hypothetical protein